MKRFLIAFACGLLLLALLAGCGKKEETTNDTSAAGHPEEMADSTRMDSAMHDSTIMDSTMMDSTMTEEAGEAMEETSEAGH